MEAELEYGSSGTNLAQAFENRKGITSSKLSEGSDPNLPPKGLGEESRIWYPCFLNNVRNSLSFTSAPLQDVAAILSHSLISTSYIEAEREDAYAESHENPTVE